MDLLGIRIVPELLRGAESRVVQSQIFWGIKFVRWTDI